VTADETKERLVDAAAEVFADRGYEGARVAEIAKRAGLTTGAIYAHYGNKADLLSEAIQSRGPGALDGLLVGDGGRPILEMLQELAVAMGRGRKGDGSLLVEAVGAARRDPEVGRMLRKNVAVKETELAVLISHGQHAAELDPTLSPDVLARLCTTLALGSLVVRALKLEQPDPAAWADVVNRLVAGIAGPPTPGAPNPGPPSAGASSAHDPDLANDPEPANAASSPIRT